MISCGHIQDILCLFRCPLFVQVFGPSCSGILVFREGHSFLGKVRSHGRIKNSSEELLSTFGKTSFCVANHIWEESNAWVSSNHQILASLSIKLSFRPRLVALNWIEKKITQEKKKNEKYMFFSFHFLVLFCCHDNESQCPSLDF